MTSLSGDFPLLHTERLQLDQISAADAEELFILRADERVMQYIDRPRPADTADILQLIDRLETGRQEGQCLVWGMRLRGAPALVGTIGYHRIEAGNFRAEVGYMMHPDLNAQGLMSEALQEVLRYGFGAMQLHSIEARINPGNERSRKILLRHGFVKEAYLRQNYYFRGQFLDTEIYSLLKPAREPA